MKWQLLHQACWAGDCAEVRRLLDAGANPNQIAPTEWRQTPLGRTLEFRVSQPKHAGHVDVVLALLDKCADASVRSTYLDLTPYELASFCGLEGAAELLREYPVGPPHPGGMTELWMAAASRLPEAGQLDAVRRLANADNIDAIWRKATPLMMATGHAGHFHVADALLEAGAHTGAGTSLLHASCDWHFEHLVPALRYLVGKGWTVDARDGAGQTALHKAAFLGYASAVRALLALGADAAARDSSGATALDIADAAKQAAVIKTLS